MTAAETRIEPARGWNPPDPAELWRYRELLFFFAWRDVKVRYKQTLLGVTWAALQPLLSLAVFVIFLGRVAETGTGRLPYALFAYSGLIAWNYFAKAVGGASNCLVGSAQLVTKVYFPRLLIPAGILASGLADFVIALLLALPLTLYYGVPPSPGAVILVPLVMAVMMAFALGLSLALSALQAKYRDVGYAIGFLTQLWMFATPVVYPLAFVPEHLRWLCRLNPMTGIIEGFRSALFGTDWDGAAFSASAFAAAAVLAVGLVTFRSLERRFADYL